MLSVSNELIDNCFSDWKEREALAEGMIPLVGKLYRHDNVKTYIYGHPLVNRSVIEIMQDHRVARQIEGNELSEFETFNAKAQELLFFGSLFLGINLIFSSILLYKYATTKSPKIINPSETSNL